MTDQTIREGMAALERAALAGEDDLAYCLDSIANGQALLDSRTVSR
jgi:hypothetical protein